MIMREAIRETLLSVVPDLKDCLEPQVAGPTTSKPFAVVQQGVDTEEDIWLGFRRIIEVWPFLERTSFTEVDSLNKKIIDALNNKLLTDSTTGEVFSCVYLGTTGNDQVIEDWNAITRGLRFAVMALQPVAINETVASDSWVEAMASWSESLLGSTWSVYRNQWPLGYKRPAVLWRLSDWSMEPMTRSGFKVKKTLFCHVIGVSPNDQIKTAKQIVTEMANSIKLPLDSIAKTYVTIESQKIDYKVDALQRGQITVNLSRNSSRPQPDIPVMQVIDSTGYISGGGAVIG
jgi:hypothetical protein